MKILSRIHVNNSWSGPSYVKGMKKRLFILTSFILLLLKAVCVHLDLQGPVFLYEPPHRIEFSNTSGGKVDCQAHGVPFPVLEWILADGTPVTQVTDIRVPHGNGSLIFPPFPPEKFRHDVHAAVYRCIAKNEVGVIFSKDVIVKAVVDQNYDVQVYDEYVINGNTAVMRCQVPNYLSDYILVTSWIQDGVVHIYPTTDTGGKYALFKTGELFIFNVSSVDSYKSYSCRTVNKLTGKSQSNAYPARVIITEGIKQIPPRLGVDKHSTKYVKMGEDVLLQCIVQGYPTPTHRWYKEEKDKSFPVEPDKRFMEIAGGFLLQIAKTKLQDGGKYICQVNNSAGKDTIHVNLVVLAPLSAHIQPQNLIVDLYKEAEFSCATGGFPVSSVRWFHNGRPIIQGERHKIKIHPDRLYVKPVQKDDFGMYQCFISNEWEMVQSSAELQLGDASPELLSWFTGQTLQPGPGLSLKCSATGNPPPHFHWTLDGFPVPDNNRFMIGQYITINDDVITHLNISSTEEEDGGEYTCTAKNTIAQVSHSARINIYGRPYIRRMPKIKAVAGVDLVIKCPVAGYPIESITWEQAGVTLPINHRQKVFFNGTLIIENVQKESDSGTYTCQARNSQRHSDRKDVEVYVMVLPKILPIQDIVLREGMRAAITCQIIEGDLPFKFRWEKNGEAIVGGSKFQIRRVDEYASLLVIDGITTLHTGNYTCFTENVAGIVSFTVPLTVNVPPKWQLEPADTNVVAGLDVMVDCQATGFPLPTILWKKSIGPHLGEYKEFSYEPNISVFPNGSLKLVKVSKDDEGHYLCEAKNEVGSGVSKLIYLKVNLRAHFTQNVKQMQAIEGEEAHLQCPAIGDAPIEIHWKFKGQKILEGKETRYMIREQLLDDGLVSELSITETRRRDTGVFSCHARNAFGQDEMKIQFIVQEVPEPPVNVNVNDQESRSLQISWSRPYAGNSPIIQYIVQYKFVEDEWETALNEIIVPGIKTSASIENLRPAKSYHIRIFAENILGKSDPSEDIKVTTQEEAPTGVPINVNAEAESSTGIRVTWEPPSMTQQNGKLLGYYVGYKKKSSIGTLVNVSFESSGYDFKTVETKARDKEETMIEKLDKFTLYSIIVQAFNSKGAGPFSIPVTVRTKEDVPSSPPSNMKCQTTSSQSIEVTWKSPALEAQNGFLLGYKLAYRPADESSGDEEIKTKVATSTKTTISGLSKYTNYSLTLLAFTSAGDGVKTNSFFCKTGEDVPSAPKEVKVALSSTSKIMVTWLPPKHENGQLICYTVYMSSVEGGKEEGTHKKVVSSEITSYETFRQRDKTTYQFWVTASTKIGEGESSKVISIPFSNRVPARIMSFGRNIVTPWKETLNLTCRRVGLPPPQSIWKFKQKILGGSGGRRQVYKDGSLIIKDVQKSDEGNYSCSVENIHGKDEIIYGIIVRVPPERPKLSIVSSTSESLQLEWTVNGVIPENRILGYVINYKRDYGDWEEVQLGANFNSYLLKNLWCATRYQLYITAFNKIGMGLPCDIINAHTLGGVPVQPKENNLVKTNATSATIWLNTWLDGGCPISFFVIEYKISHLSSSWSLASDKVRPSDRIYTLSELLPSTRYDVKITAHNNAGFSEALYNFTTLTVDGLSLLTTGDNENSNSTDVPFYKNQINIITLIVAASSMCILLSTTIFFIRKKKSVQESIPNLREPSYPQMENETNPDHQYISIGVSRKFSTERKSFTLKEDEYNTEICPYAAFKISELPSHYSESSYSGNIYGGAYNSVKSSLPFQDLKSDSGGIKMKKNRDDTKVRRKGGKFGDVQSESQESDNVGSTDSEVKKIFSLHLPITEYDTLGSDSDGEPAHRTESHKQDRTLLRYPSRSGKSGTRAGGDDSSTSSENSQNDMKFSIRKSRSKGQFMKKNVRSSSGYSSHTEETTFSTHPTLKLMNIHLRKQENTFHSEGKSIGKQKSPINKTPSAKFNKETAAFRIDV